MKLTPHQRILLEDSPELLAEFIPDVKNGEKGEKGNSPTKEELISLIEPLIPEPLKGEDYILTDADKAEIASQIEVPIVEKIIEKTKVIHEQPIVTNEVTNEIKEVAVTDEPEIIADKLNTLKEAVDVSVIKGAVSSKELIDGIAKIDGRVKLIDQRWHGAGLSKVSHDATLTGDGTPSNPLGAVSSGGIPSAPTTSIQFNDSGSFGGDADHTWNKTTNTETLSNGNLTLAKSVLNFTYEGTPSIPTIALVTTGTGNVTNGTHRMKVTFVTANGETEAGAQSASVTVDNTHKQISLSAIPTGSASVTGRNIYMTKAGGTTFFRLGSSPTIADNTTTTFTINVADASLSTATAPASNTTAGSIFAAGVRRTLYDSATGNTSEFTPYFQVATTAGVEKFFVDTANSLIYAVQFTSDQTGSLLSEHFGRSSVAASGGVSFGNSANADVRGAAFGANSVALSDAIAVGNGSQSGQSGIALGRGAIASTANAAIGLNALSNYTFGISIVLNYNDLWLGNNQVGTAWNSVIHSPDIFPGNPNGDAGSITIQTGLSTGSGVGGDVMIKQSPPGAPGTSSNAAVEHVHVYARSGQAVFTGEISTITAPLNAAGTIVYAPTTGLFLTGYAADNVTSRDYRLYAKSPAGGGIWSPVASVTNAPFVDNGSMLDINGSIPTGANAGTTYDVGTYQADTTVRDYQIYAASTLNGNIVFCPTYAATTTNPGQNTMVPDVSSPSITPGSGGTYGPDSDFRQYQIYGYCQYNGVDLYSSNPASVSATGDGFSILVSYDLSWSPIAFPSNSINQQYRILRNVNFAGFNEYVDTGSTTPTYSDTADGNWTPGSTVTPTSTPSLYEVNLTWAAASFLPYSSANFYRILRQVASGGFSEYVDVAEPTISFNDTGNGLWSSGSTVTPTSVPNFYQIPFSWTAVAGASGYKMIRTISGTDDATDIGVTTSFTDAGTLAWADSTTVTPTSAPGFITALNNASSGVNSLTTSGDPGVPIFGNNASAIAGGLSIGDFYRSGGDPDALSIVH